MAFSHQGPEFNRNLPIKTVKIAANDYLKMKIPGIFLTANSVRLAVTCLQQSIPFAQVEMQNKTKRPKTFFRGSFVKNETYHKVDCGPR